MDTRTGDLYPTKQAALDAGVPEDSVVEVSGTKKAIAGLRRRVRMAARNENARRKTRRMVEKRSRSANRKRR
jgi:hypothetical protein